LYSSQNIITKIKSRRVRFAGHVTRMEEERKAYKVSVGRPQGKRPLGDRRADGRTGYEWILGRLDGVCEVNSVGSE
jgi:hypothetical protein